MAAEKTYLNVPFAQKDAAKALGARWDPAMKKWYVPADKDMALFAQWQTVAVTSVPTNDKPQARAVAKTIDVAKGVITIAEDKHFVAYSGDVPPWE